MWHTQWVGIPSQFSAFCDWWCFIRISAQCYDTKVLVSVRIIILKGTSEPSMGWRMWHGGLKDVQTHIQNGLASTWGSCTMHCAQFMRSWEENSSLFQRGNLVWANKTSDYQVDRASRQANKIFVSLFKASYKFHSPPVSGQRILASLFPELIAQNTLLESS